MRSPRCTAVVTLLLALACSWIAAPTASAAEYAAPVASGCPNSYNSGGRDAQGTLYIPCGGASVRIVPVTGPSRTVAISHAASRIAPSPDGRYLYSIQENWSGRYVRQADGSYARDAAFRFELPAAYAANGWPICGWGVATDGYGDIYLSIGGWCISASQVLKYSPDGRLLTSFGDWGASAVWEFRIGGTPGGAVCVVNSSPNCLQVLKENRVGAEPGRFNANFTIAVTTDGSRVYVADNNNMRIQWFDRIGGAAYEYAGMWNGEEAMFPTSVMGSTYGVAVDPWGSVYVAATTRAEVWRIDRDGGNPVRVHARPGGTRPHTLAVDGRGSVWVGEWGSRIDRVTPVAAPIPLLPPKPPIDRADPVLSAITVPVETTEASVTVQLTATDDVAVTEMRIADESGDWRAWQPYAATFQLELSAGLGGKWVYVQVRDGRKAESTVLNRVLTRRAVPDTVAPTVAATLVGLPDGRLARLSVSASDAIGVSHLRIAGDDGVFGAWLPWATGVRELAHDMGSAIGTHTASVQVRDAAFNVSDTATIRIVVPPLVVVTPAATVPVAPPASLLATPIVAAGGDGVVAAPVPAAARDTRAPTIRTLRVPPRSCSRVVTLRLTSLDDRGATLVRVANEDGRYGRWQRYRGSVRHALTRGATRKLVTVQVADAAGNVSAPVSRRLVVVRCR